LDFVRRDDVESVRLFFAKKDFDWDLEVGDATNLWHLGLSLTVSKGPVSDHAARAGAEGVFRYVLGNGARVTNTTMKNAFAGGNIEILRLLTSRVPMDDASKAEVATWAAASIMSWNFIQTNWLLVSMRPDVLRDAEHSRYVWLAAAYARDLALLGTVTKPEFHFAQGAHEFLALVCTAKGSDQSDPVEVVEKLLKSDDVEGLAMFALAMSTGVLERCSFRGDAISFAVRFVMNIEVIEAVLERVELGPDDPSPLMAACVANSRGLAIWLLNSGCEVDRAAALNSCLLSALALMCLKGHEWRDVVEFVCSKVTLGKADFPPGERVRGAVHWACESGSAAIVKAVCGRGVVDVNRVDQLGNCGLWYALRARASDGEVTEMARVLFERGFTLDGERLSLVPGLLSAFHPVPQLVAFLFRRGLGWWTQIPGGGTVRDVLWRDYGGVRARFGVRGVC
jgi:hypothetical protein